MGSSGKLFMEKNKMIDNDLKSLRKQENDEILKHLEAISKIINVKCKRCKSILGCLGCVFSQGEVVGDISHAYKLMQVEVASYHKRDS